MSGGWEGEEAEDGEGWEGTRLTQPGPGPQQRKRSAGRSSIPRRGSGEHLERRGVTHCDVEAVGGAAGDARELNWNVIGVRCL